MLCEVEQPILHFSVGSLICGSMDDWANFPFVARSFSSERHRGEYANNDIFVIVPSALLEGKTRRVSFFPEDFSSFSPV